MGLGVCINNWGELYCIIFFRNNKYVINYHVNNFWNFEKNALLQALVVSS